MHKYNIKNASAWILFTFPKQNKIGNLKPHIYDTYFPNFPNQATLWQTQIYECNTTLKCHVYFSATYLFIVDIKI